MNNSDLLNELAAEVRLNAVFNIKREGMFRNVLKGCFVKTYEFTVVAQSDQSRPYAFFMTPTLRGICEDFIALLFLRRKRSAEQRHKLVGDKALQQVSEAARKQAVFFAKYRPFQPVFSVDPAFSAPAANLPPVRNMAQDVGLSNLYDFIYAITSDVVHFNPRIIIRNAWGADERSFEHSTANFQGYYLQFARIYSLYFFCRFSRAFARDLKLSRAFKETLSALEESLHNELRWPEAVTFEEMNLKGPTDVIRILMHSAQRVTHRKRALRKS